MMDINIGLREIGEGRFGSIHKLGPNCTYINRQEAVYDILHCTIDQSIFRFQKSKSEIFES